MTREHLIPITERSPEERRAIQSKGGRGDKTKQIISQKTTWIKKRAKEGRLKTGDAEWLAERILDPQAFSADLLADLDEIRKSPELSAKEKMMANNLYNQAFKTIHGEKSIVESRNLNININVMSEEELKDAAESILGSIEDHG